MLAVSDTIFYTNFNFLLIVRAEQGVKVAGGTQMNFGGLGYEGCRLAEIDKGWGVAGKKQGRRSATGPCTANT